MGILAHCQVNVRQNQVNLAKGFSQSVTGQEKMRRWYLAEEQIFVMAPNNSGIIINKN